MTERAPSPTQIPRRLGMTERAASRAPSLGNRIDGGERFRMGLGAAEPPVEPVHGDRMPQSRVYGLQDPVPFIGKGQELRGHALELERAEKLETLAEGDAIVLLAGHDEGRGLEVLDGEHRDPLAVELRLPGPAS